MASVMLIILDTGNLVSVFFQLARRNLYLLVVALFLRAIFLTIHSIWFLQAVKKGDTIFIGHYLFTGSETTSVWLEVRKVELEI